MADDPDPSPENIPADVRKTTPVTQQLVFDLFSSAVAENKAIVDIDKDLGFHKSQILIDMTDLSRLCRQFINAALFLTEPDFEEQEKDLKLFQWTMNYPSRNITHFKKVASEAQKSSVKVQIYDHKNPEKDTWISVPLLGTMAISGGRIYYKVPVEIRQQLKDPDKRSYLSMRIATSFTTQYSLELYEKLLEYLPVGHSPWMTVDQFSNWIRVANLKSSKDFRYMKRDIIQPAIEQINHISNIEIALETKPVPGSKKVAMVRFSVKKNMTGTLSPYNAAKLQNANIFNILIEEFGLSDSEVSEIASNRETYTDERILSAIEYTRHRISSPESQIKYPSLYIMKALRDNYRMPKILKEKVAQNDPKVRDAREKAREEKGKSLVDQSATSLKVEQTALRDQVIAVFKNLSATDREEIWGVFSRSLPGKAALKRAGINAEDSAALDNEIIQDALSAYIASKKKYATALSQAPLSN